MRELINSIPWMQKFYDPAWRSRIPAFMKKGVPL
jgi:hypothetical protein